jgi:hypothetical protein
MQTTMVYAFMITMIIIIIYVDVFGTEDEGIDSANGRAGTNDTCDAETESDCEA